MTLHQTTPSPQSRRTHGKLAGLALLGALAAAAPGCAGDSDVPDAGRDLEQPSCEASCEGEPWTLIVGSGVVDPDSGLVTFAPIEPGQELLVVPGWQGGQHIWIILRAEGGAPDCYFAPRYQLWDGDELVEQRYYGGEFYPLRDQADVYEFPAFAFQVESENVHRRELELVVEGLDGCGHELGAGVDVVPYDERLDDPVGDMGADADADMGADVAEDPSPDAGSDMTDDAPGF